jgi:hypothetical protein
MCIFSSSYHHFALHGSACYIIVVSRQYKYISGFRSIPINKLIVHRPNIPIYNDEIKRYMFENKSKVICSIRLYVQEKKNERTDEHSFTGYLATTSSKQVPLLGRAPFLCVQLSTMLPQAHHWFVCPALLGHFPCTCQLGKDISQLILLKELLSPIALTSSNRWLRCNLIYK